LHILLRVPQLTATNYVLGGGTAGLVLAARLSEDPNVSVCVLEDGDANLDDASIRTASSSFTACEPPLTHLCIVHTGVFASNFLKTNYDWAHMTVFVN
jgi:choline dehydrogenase-like flavoprotein